MDSLTVTFCLIDDFCRAFEPAFHKRLLANGSKKRRRKCELSLSELMTLTVLFHQLRFRQFKGFYLGYACRHLRAEFPRLPSYQRVVELMPRCLAPLAALFECLKGQCDGVSIADATSIAVCDKRNSLSLRRQRVAALLLKRCGLFSTALAYGGRVNSTALPWSLALRQGGISAIHAGTTAFRLWLMGMLKFKAGTAQVSNR